MSVFIRKIQRSKNCIKCPCFDDGRLSCKAEGKSLLDEEYYVRRPDWCPIIDVLTEQDLFRRWIPVSERLPEPSIDTWVLGYCPGHDEYRVRSHFDVLHYEKSWWVDIYGHCLGLDYISHWMPLPEGPEEGE